MKDKSKKIGIIKKTGIIAALVSAAYVVIQLLDIGTFVSTGAWLLIGAPFSSINTATALSVFLAYVFQILTLVTPALIIGLLLAVTKRPNAFKIAFLSVLIAHLLSLLLGFLLFYMPMLRFVIYFVSMFVAYITTRAILKRVARPLPVWAIIIGLAVVITVAGPTISNAINRPIAEKRQADTFQMSLEKIKFTPYYPLYIPEGLTATGAVFEGYQNLSFQHQYIRYNIGKLEVRISEKLINQEPVFNKSDNCDISAIWFEMQSKSEISQSRAESSRDNLVPCHVMGKTIDGHEVYSDARKILGDYYYMEIDGTIIIMKYDELTKRNHASVSEDEILKVFSSMEKLDSSKIKQFAK